MYTKIKHLITLVVLLFIGTNQASASHFAGADITYTCVGPNQYYVTLTLYRDCAGITMPTTVPININSASCNLSIPPVTLNLDTTYEVSQLCAPELINSACNTGGTGQYPGIEVYQYSALVTFPQACSDWILSWSNCCRNNAITTLTTAGSMYVEAMINSNLCNSSPSFTSNPTPYFCAGQCYDYNHGAFDPDNDSLLYELTCPLQGAGNCIPNIAGLSPTQPLFTSPANSFAFNTQTGQMSFCTQPGLAQFAVACVTVYQIVNGDTVGYVQRDIQMIVLNNVNCTSPVGSNNPLVFAGGSFDTTSNTFVVCSGETLIFGVVLADPDGDTIQLDPLNTNLDQVFGSGNWTILTNTSPPFSHDSVQIFVQVFANASNIGVNNFTIGVTDNACPVPGDQILGFNLIVPGVEVTASDTTICPGISQTVQLNAESFSTVGSFSAGTFTWLQTSGPPVTFSDDTIPNPVVTIPSNTVDGDSIVLEVTFTTIPDPISGTQCVTTDDVVIYLSALPLTLVMNATDTTLCPNNQVDTIGLSSSIFGPGIDLINGVYSWTSTPASYLSDLSSTTINNPSAYLSGLPNDSVTFTLTYTYGLCVGSSDIKLKWTPGIPDVSALNDSICPGDTTQLFVSLTDTITFSDPTACSTYTVAPITFSPISGAGTNVSLSDDALSGALPIGFDFEFFCNTYNQFRISSNGYITFDLGATSSGCCSGQLLPNPSTPNNLIALAWCDLNPASGGSINYLTIGTAPNRILVVNYVGVPRFGGSVPNTGQILLYEGTNIVEVHSTSISSNGSTNTTQGIENIDGTLGYAVPGRNSNPGWTATNDAYRFSPGIAFLFGPLTYNWSPGFAVSNPNSDSPLAFPLGTTTYVVEVNEDGCVQTDSIDIYVNSLIPAPVVSCGTPANQATSILFEWGQAPGAAGWEYSLDSGITFIPLPLQDSFFLITGLTNGDCANILVRAVGGAGPCATNAATYLECCTTPCPMPNNTVTTDLTCYDVPDGTLQIAIQGGVLGDHPDFTAMLYDTSGNVLVNTLSGPDTITFTGLPAGTYYAFLTDTLGCFTNSDTVTITEPDSMYLSLDSSVLTTCFATADGAAYVSANGGTPGYSYQWDAATGNQTGPAATGLPRGTYQVVMLDSRGCTDTLDVDVNSPFSNVPNLTLNPTNSTSCTGNGIATVFTTINMVGDANNFSFVWSDGQTTPSAVGLAPGQYSVTVVDENGCVASAATSITGSATINTNLITISPGCGSSDGQITAVPIGDSIGYNFQWSPNAFGQTGALVTGLGVGNYYVIVTGVSNGCVDTTYLSLSNDTLISILGFNNTDPSCGLNDGVLDVVTTGATGAVNYVWTGGTLGANGTTNPLTGVGAGTYNVTVTDVLSNCQVSGTTTLSDPPLPNVDYTTVNNPSCNLSDGSITVTGTPGPFTYLWSDGQTTATAQGLAAATPYSCTVTYQGCDIALPDTSLANTQLQIAITDKDDINCNGDSSSYANVSVLSGNLASTNFQWSNGATTQNISGLGAGTYTVTASSGNCVVTQSITVVNVQLDLDPWIAQPGQTNETIQVNDLVDINANLTTNQSLVDYLWFADTPYIGTITDTTLAATTFLGELRGWTWLYVEATSGPCYTIDSILVTVEQYMGMPTAFTPNGDGINDLFQPAGLTNSDKVLKFEIYNRWGQLIFSDNQNHFWDGTINGVPQPTEMYIYIFEYAPLNGDPVNIRGEFMLIR